jgi:4-hydroxy-3-polyprenylbenzoate decarboxylase
MFIQKCRDLGEVKDIEGADRDLEIGAIGELFESQAKRPLLLFDAIPGYQRGFRVASNIFASPRRTALAYGFDLNLNGLDLVRAMREKIKAGVKLTPPVEVKSAPVKENIITGDQVDLLKFPAPKWHARDGGPYIGTGSAVIVRDPDKGWVNVACYRVQVQNKNTASIMIIQGHHGLVIEKKYWEKGKPLPVAVCCGQEPLLWAAAGWEGKEWGVSEYDFAGGLAGSPVEVTRGVFTDLPIPANAEIVLEGEIPPPGQEMVTEGPFGEWAGYYAAGAASLPPFKVKAILHRNNPIIQGNPPSLLPSVWTLGRHWQKAASLWDALDKQVPGIAGVWVVEEAAIHGMVVISLKQAYPGHAKHTGLLAAGSSATRIGCRFIILVDDDIDPSDLTQVLWAMSTRTDPESQIDIVRGCYGSVASPAIPPEKRIAGQFEESRAIINACRPFHHIKDYPPSIRSDAATLAQVRKKWDSLFS